MTLLKKKSSIKTLVKGDPKWIITDGHMLSPRAGFKISCRCPEEYKFVLNECLLHGWIQPVAYMREDEYMWELLKD